MVVTSGIVMQKFFKQWIFLFLAFSITACQWIAPALPVTPNRPASPSSTAFSPAPTEIPVPTETSTPIPTITPTPTPEFTRFAVIGDYGTGDSNEASVAKLVHSWNPDFIITVGDNNYSQGAYETMDEKVGQFYHDYIYPYFGSYGQGATENRFFPTLGNHDWYTPGAQPYLDTFTLPGNERYYDFVWGTMHFFAVDSDANEPDGYSVDSAQAAWLKAGLESSSSDWNIVYFHYAPYSSSFHGSIEYMRWPFAAWGADVVLSGHDHNYERLLVDGIPYFVNGLGGAKIYDFKEPLPESQMRFNATYGAMLVTEKPGELLFEFYTRHNELVDTYRITK
jgi:tartrate-resistant acid phosphatase type 5